MTQARANAVSLKKDLLGKCKVKYPCPACGEGLTSPLKDMGGKDTCPACHNRFTVPISAEGQQLLAQQQEREVQLENQRRLNQEQKQREREEKARRKESLRQLRRDTETSVANFHALASGLSPDRQTEREREERAWKWRSHRSVRAVFIFSGLVSLLAFFAFWTLMSQAGSAIQEASVSSAVTTVVVTAYVLARCVEKTIGVGYD